MKRIVSLLLCAVLLICAASTEAEKPADLPEWIELSADDAVLTVRVPLTDAQNQSCRFLISDERMLELLTCETVGDEDGEAGDPMWAGSFMSANQKSGHVFLQLSVADSGGKSLYARTLWLFVREDGAIEVVSSDADSWFILTDDGCSLSVSLQSNPTTGFQWAYELSDEEILCCAAEEYIADPVEGPVCGSGGVWSARFAATGKKAGFVDLHLSYARPWETGRSADERTLHFFVNESGMIQPIVPRPADEAPLGRYEAADGSTLVIHRRADGTFSFEISIIRLTLQDDGEGIYENGSLTGAATDASGNPMTWEITRNGEGVKAAVIDSKWELLPEGSEFSFLPVSE